MLLAGAPQGLAKRQIQLHATRRCRGIDLSLRGRTSRADIPYSAAASEANAIANRFWAISSLVASVPPLEYSPDARLCGTSIMIAGIATRRALYPLHSHRERRSYRSVEAVSRRRAAESPANPAPMINQSAVDVAFEAADGKRTLADRLPARDAVFRRQTLDGLRGHLTVSSTDRSDTSIQIVLSSQ